MILSLLIWTPLVGALSLLALGSSKGGSPKVGIDTEGSHGHHSLDHSTDHGGHDSQHLPFFGLGGLRAVAIFWSLVTLGISLCVHARWDGGADPQFVENFRWLPALGSSYALAIDGISMYLVLLTTALMPLVLFTSWGITKQLKGYLISMLVLESAMLGTLLATDLFLFYIFWELMLAPMYFIIGIWGGKRRVYATVKFVLYTVAGSVLMLVALLFLVWKSYQSTGMVSFALADLLAGNFLSMQEELWLFLCFALAFGIKVPIFPFHTWLPDAHVEAPTGGSVVLAGVLLKMGLYGFIRFAYPLFPRAAEVATPLIAGLAVIGIVYGALVAWVQQDMKKLVAYSSVSHLGYCVLGFFALNALSVSGSIIQMVNHGISTGALFLLVGVLYERTHSREISDYSGLAGKLPIYATLFIVFTLSSIAVPLTNGFVGEFMILTGSFQSEIGGDLFKLLTGVALLGVVLGAVYMLTLAKNILFGEYRISVHGAPLQEELKDVNRKELLAFIPLLFFVFYLGVRPQPLIDALQPSVERYLEQIQQRLDRLPQAAVGLPVKVEGVSDRPVEQQAVAATVATNYSTFSLGQLGILGTEVQPASKG